MTSSRPLPEGFQLRELTAPSIQRLARKGTEQQLSSSECAELCECVVLHVEDVLRRSRIPRALRRTPGRPKPLTR